MLNIKQLLKSRKGFTLMELVCGLCIGSIILGICYSLLLFSLKTNIFSDEADDLLYNGNFAIEYLKHEIQNADKIIVSDKIKDFKRLYPNNIGFVIMEHRVLTDEYSYSTYIIKENKLVRIAREFEKEINLNAAALAGYNEISEDISSFGNTNVDWDNKLLYLDLGTSERKFIDKFKSTIALNCELDY